MSHEEPLFCVGIDFGTSCSGYAYISGGGCTYVKQKNEYPDQGSPYPKTPTVILYNGHYEPEAWGWTAYKKFFSKDKKARSECYLIQDVKLCLSGQEGAPSLPGGLTPGRIIRDYLHYLHEDFLESLRREHPHTFDPSRIRYSLTVPAGWGEAAKHIMREAAVGAGIVDTVSSSQLLLLSEPEAAALKITMDCCQQLKVGDAVMVVDAGGGTVDITVHDLVHTGAGTGLAEATSRLGLNMGSRMIDRTFEAHLCERLGSEAVHTWKSRPSSSIHYLRFMNVYWENLKKGFGFDDIETVCELDIPSSLDKLICPSVREQLLLEQDEDGALYMYGETVASFFDVVVPSVLRAVDEVLQRCPKEPSQIWLVGGLGSSKYLIHEIQKYLSVRNIPLTVPQYGYAAVVEGAALFAQDPTRVQARRSQLSYGIRFSRKLQEGAPDGDDHQFHQDGQLYCRSHFYQFVSRNQLVAVDEKVEHVFRPVVPHQQEVEVEIWGTDKDGSRYVTDEGMRQLGQLVVKIKDPERLTDPSSYKLRAVMRFGTSEVEVEVWDEQHQEKIDTWLTFSSAPWQETRQ